MEKFSTFLEKHKYICLLYPPQYDLYKTCSFILMNKIFVGNNIMILSKNKDMINKILPTQLPDDFFAKYNEKNKINKFINIFDKNIYNYLIIDDLKLLRISNIDIYTKISKNTIIIIMCSMYIEIEDVNYVKNNDLNCVKINISNEGPLLEYKIHSSNITNLQKTIMNKETDTEKILNGYTDKDIWSIEDINNISQKITKLLTTIFTYLGDRHIIYTKYIDIIEKYIHPILDEFKYKYVILNADDSNTYINEQLDSWSKYYDEPNKSYTILITSITPTKILYNVSHIHIMDKINYFEYRALLDNVYKKENYKFPIGKLIIHFHISITEQNNDNMMGYTELSKRLYDEQYLYSTLLKKSNQLSFDVKYGLIIM